MGLDNEFNKALIIFDESCSLHGRDAIVTYGLESPDDDYPVMPSHFNNGHYAWALFLSHLVTGKLPKVYYVKRADINCPGIHNPAEMSVKANLETANEQSEAAIGGQAQGHLAC